jgi:hypothetical protein
MSALGHTGWAFDNGTIPALSKALLHTWGNTRNIYQVELTPYSGLFRLCEIYFWTENELSRKPRGSWDHLDGVRRIRLVLGALRQIPLKLHVWSWVTLFLCENNTVHDCCTGPF